MLVILIKLKLINSILNHFFELDNKHVHEPIFGFLNSLRCTKRNINITNE